MVIGNFHHLVTFSTPDVKLFFMDFTNLSMATYAMVPHLPCSLENFVSREKLILICVTYVHN